MIIGRSNQDKSMAADQVARIASAGVGATARLLWTPLAGPPAAAGSQFALEALAGITNAASDRRRRRATAPLAYVAASRRQTFDELTEQLVEDPAMLDLAAAVLSAAATTTLDEKLTALGRVLCNVVTDRAKLDEEWMVADALGIIEPPHLKVLACLCRLFERAEPTYANINQVHAELPELGLGLRPILSTLKTKALVIDYDGLGGKAYALAMSAATEEALQRNWAPTEFGREIVRRLREAGLESHSASELAKTAE